MLKLLNKTPGKRFFLLFGVFCFSFLSAQINLVPNPSFEDTISIPRNHGEMNRCKDWYVAGGSPDYFSIYSPIVPPFPYPIGASVHVPNSCFGFQNARTGNFHSGMILRSSSSSIFNVRELIGVNLIQPLLADHSYSFTLYYSLADGSKISTNQLAVYFTNSQFIPPNNLSDSNSYFNYLQAQISHDPSFITDTANWIPLTGCFLAKGGEDYFIIGNLKDALHSPTTTVNGSAFQCTPDLNNFAYIFIDDVSLYDMGLYLPAVCKNDTLVCNGTSFAIGNNIKDSAIVAWNPPTALSCTNCPNPVASPTTTTTYYLNKNICGASSKDSILVQVHTPTATANAGNDKIICIGDNIQIGISDSTNFTSYNWQFSGSLSCTNCALPFANPTVSTTYTVQRTECASVTTDTVRVIIDDCDPTFTVPNVFTPNYDDVNDTWGIDFSTVNSHITNFKMNIYDRWGLEVYCTNCHPELAEMSKPNSRWDGHTNSGEECSAGVYFYIITFEKNGEEKKLTGPLSLFR